MNREKFDQVSYAYNEFSKVRCTLRQACIEYLSQVLADSPDRLIEIDDDVAVCVPYDGGNHPEYASNCFSVVHSVSLDNNGDIYLDIEDCSKYEIINIDTQHLYDVCESVYDTLNPE